MKKPRLWKNPLRTRGTPYLLAAVSSNATSSQFYPSASEWLDPWPARRAPRPAPIMMKSNFASTTTVQKRCLSAFCYYTRPFQFRLREHHACTVWPHHFPKRQYLHNMQVIKSQWKREKITLLSINLHFYGIVCLVPYGFEFLLFHTYSLLFDNWINCIELIVAYRITLCLN